MLFDHYTSLSCIVLVLLFVLGVSITEGQEVAGSFEQLQPRASVGDHVTVTDITGREVRGTHRVDNESDTSADPCSPGDD
jgi:hypothetical protein